MAEHWRHETGGRTEVMRGDGDPGYFAGWALSMAATLSAVLLVAHFGL